MEQPLQRERDRNERGSGTEFDFSRIRGSPVSDESVTQQRQRVTFVCDFKESSSEILDPRLKPDTRFYQEERVQLLTVESRKFIAAAVAATLVPTHSQPQEHEHSDNQRNYAHDSDYRISSSKETHLAHSPEDTSNSNQYIGRTINVNDDDVFLVPPEPSPRPHSRNFRLPRNARQGFRTGNARDQIGRAHV